MKSIQSTIVPLKIQNIDTDQVIPAQYLKALSKKDLSVGLFANWKYSKDGSLNKNFVLNSDQYKGSILLTLENFGCGSSREHAVWAIKEYGFKAIIAPSFADIFKINSYNNNLLLIQLSDETVNLFFNLTEAEPGLIFSVDISNQTINIPSHSLSFHFEINAFQKTCILNEIDKVDYLLNNLGKVFSYEQKLAI